MRAACQLPQRGPTDVDDACTCMIIKHLIINNDDAGQIFMILCSLLIFLQINFFTKFIQSNTSVRPNILSGLIWVNCLQRLTCTADDKNVYDMVKSCAKLTEVTEHYTPRLHSTDIKASLHRLSEKRDIVYQPT